MNPRFVVRPFDPTRDLGGVCRAVREGFWATFWPLAEQASPRLLEDMVKIVIGVGDVALVAEAEGEARGILIGWFPERVVAQMAVRGVGTGWRIMLRILANTYRASPLARALLRDLARAGLAHTFHHPPTPSEILLLTSQAAFRRGIGRVLVDGWVRETQARGYTRVTVATDTLANYGFYERYGFRRIREYPVPPPRLLGPGAKVTGFVYELEFSPSSQWGMAADRNPGKLGS